MVFETSSIFIAIAAIKKKTLFAKMSTNPRLQTEQYESHGNSLRLLPRYAKHKQQVVRRLQKDEHCFFFQRIICKINQVREDGVFCSITES